MLNEVLKEYLVRSKKRIRDIETDLLQAKQRHEEFLKAIDDDDRAKINDMINRLG